MITHDQIYMMLLMKQRKGSLFSTLPIDIIREISTYGQNPNSEIAIALHHAAYAQKEDVAALLKLLEKNPRLLLQAGTVQTPAGHVIKRITIYEFLLGAGDAELAGMVHGYFAKINQGEQERVRQYERYRPHIEGMLTQRPYDLLPLIELIKKATPEQVEALLKKDITGDNDLCKGFIQFRKDWAPKTFTKPCMHFTHASLKHAIQLLISEWDNLIKASNFNYNKINLIWRQVIGFAMRRLPGIDRCVMAQSLQHLIEKMVALNRSYILRNGGAAADKFPVTVADNSNDGLGWDFSINLMGRTGGGQECPINWVVLYDKYVSKKQRKLIELSKPAPYQQTSLCRIS